MNFSKLLSFGRKKASRPRVEKEDVNATSIVALPTEVIEKYLLIYLSNSDVRSFGKTGNKRFQQISKNVIRKRGKLNCCNI
jgi:hypothetical protein